MEYQTGSSLKGMDQVSFPRMSRVAICGGTHGNELSGVYVVREMQKQKVGKVGSVSVTTVLSNPHAIDACRRYTETDLNRCFTSDLLSSPLTDSSPYELRQAQELNAQFGPKGSEDAVDVLIDLHNTTSNMGVTVILYSQDLFSQHLCRHLKMKMAPVPVTAIQLDLSNSDAYSFDSVGKHGFSLEVGPQPHGVIRADVYNMMKKAVDITIDRIEEFNSGCTFEGGEVEMFCYVRSVDYPRDPMCGEITAAIHPQLQDNDFQLLQPGDPTFLSFTGETVKHEGGEGLYPFFINESAYYEKRIAFHLAQKVKMTLPSIHVKTK